MVLISKPGKEPPLTSTFWPISVLPALSKVWEHTFESLFEENPGLNPSINMGSEEGVAVLTPCAVWLILPTGPKEETE